MAYIEINPWWSATEIPLTEDDWRSIRRYCNEDDDPLSWDRCVYLFRLSPPFCICYGDDCDLESPLIYVGSGSIRHRWGQHRNWLAELGRELPGARYEVRVCRPRARNNFEVYADVEADILRDFSDRSQGWKPLWNKRTERHQRVHSYGDGFFEFVTQSDRRYKWSMYPTKGAFAAAYQR